MRKAGARKLLDQFENVAELRSCLLSEMKIQAPFVVNRVFL